MWMPVSPTTSRAASDPSPFPNPPAPPALPLDPLRGAAENTPSRTNGDAVRSREGGDTSWCFSQSNHVNVSNVTGER